MLQNRMCDGWALYPYMVVGPLSSLAAQVISMLLEVVQL